MYAAKAYIPVIVGVIMLLLNQFGINETTTVVEAITFFATSLAVYFVPNKKVGA
jgi:putative effector of murein hydrolase LrgA (UPF0299 family)